MIRLLNTALAVVVIAGGCTGGGGAADSRTIVSADGALRLILPDDSEVEATIEVTEPPPVTDAEVLGAYELGPDGTTFASPVTIEFRSELAADEDLVPIVGLFIDHGDGFESVVDAVAEVVDGVVVVTGTVDEFSKVVAVSPDHGGGRISVTLSPSSFTAVLDESVLVTATVGDQGCTNCFVELPRVRPDSDDREVAILDTSITEAASGASAWEVTCLRAGTAFYLGSVAYRIPNPLPGSTEPTWSGFVTAPGRATCLTISEATTTSTTVPLRVAFEPTCTDGSRICPVIEFGFDDPSLITIGFPDLAATPSLLTVTLRGDYEGAGMMECRSFGGVANCGRQQEDGSLVDTFDIEITPADEIVKMQIPAEALVLAFMRLPFYPVHLYLSTNEGSGEAFFTPEEQDQIRASLAAGGYLSNPEP